MVVRRDQESALSPLGQFSTDVNYFSIKEEV